MGFNPIRYFLNLAAALTFTEAAGAECLSLRSPARYSGSNNRAGDQRRYPDWEKQARSIAKLSREILTFPADFYERIFNEKFSAADLVGNSGFPRHSIA
jgi:hypothetical protein